MASIPSIDQLKRALHLQENIAKLQHELHSLFGRAGAKVLGVVESGMKMTTRGIQSIKVKAVKAGKSKAEAKPAVEKPSAKKKGKMSAAGRAAIVAAQKKRWAKVRAEKARKH